MQKKKGLPANKARAVGCGVSGKVVEGARDERQAPTATEHDIVPKQSEILQNRIFKKRKASSCSLI